MRDSNDAARKKENSPSLCANPYSRRTSLAPRFSHRSLIPTSRRLEMEMARRSVVGNLPLSEAFSEER